MSIETDFLSKGCITNTTIEKPFLHELILVQEADEKFELFNDKNAIGGIHDPYVTCWFNIKNLLF